MEIEMEIDRDSIDILNDDCLAPIFSYFTTIDIIRLEQVSKRWQRILSRTWKTMRVLDFTQKTAINWGRAPRQLNLELDTATVRKILENCGENLEAFDTSETSRLSSIILANVGEFCPNLSYAQVSLVNAIPLDDTKSIAACRNFHKLTIKSFKRSCVLSELFSKLKNLKSVEIYGKLLYDIGNSLSKLPETVEEILLESVDLDLNYFRQIVSSLPNLKSLNLSYSHDLSNPAIIAVISNIKTLRTLRLCSLSRIGCTLMRTEWLSRLPDLEVLQIDHAFYVPIVDALTGYPTVIDDCVNNRTLILIARNCPKLHWLSIAGCEFVTDVAMTDLATFLQLRTLKVNYCTNLSDSGLSQFKNLKVLSCIGCRKVKDDGIIKVLRNSPELETLDVSSTSIRNQTIEAAIDIVANRRNNIPLKLVVRNTDTVAGRNPGRLIDTKISPLLEIINDRL